MPAYVLGTIDMHDPATYVEQYVPGAFTTMTASGGTALAAGGDCQVVEGDVFLPRNVILGFPDMASALGWYNSPEYQKILPVRLATATSSLMMIEGTDEPFTPGSSYVIATMNLVDNDAYATQYAPTAIKTLTEAGGKALVRGGDRQVMEGDAFGARTVMLEFPTYEQAKAWYHSAEYQAVVPIRQGATKDAGLVLVEGMAV